MFRGVIVITSLHNSTPPAEDVLEDHSFSNDQEESSQPCNSTHAVVPFADPGLESNEGLTERGAALFLMRVTDQVSLSHTGVDKLCSSTQWFLDSVTDSIADKVQDCLRQSGITNQQVLSDVADACRPPDVFSNLSSRHYRDQYFEKNFHYVKPEPIYLGSEWEWKDVNGTKNLQEIHQHGYYISLISTLKGLLNNPAVYKETEMCHRSTDGVLRDFCDGEFFSQHPVFSRHNDALQIILYYDDIEVANPLGSRAGNHKLGMTTFTQQ
uniref:Uncharacterized protein n=1 Tax=Amphimedon queenslandica TaxID=400682 RepID=A0A1X7TS93_AMPQE